MELHEAIKGRRMTRHFSDRQIPDQLLVPILGVVSAAPSAGFSQGVELLALTSAPRRERFWALASEEQWRAHASEAPGLLRAPVIVVPLASPEAYGARYAEADKATSLLGRRPIEQWPVPYWTVDAAFVAMLVLLAAEDAGLGALFFQLHGDAQVILEGLDVPARRELIGAIALGYRDDTETARPTRARRRDLVHLEDIARTADEPDPGE
jgi:nitroreductase